MQYSRIRELRIKSGYSQATIAKKLHYTQQAYSQYELGARSIPTETLIKIADFHGVSIDYLLERTDNKEINK